MQKKKAIDKYGRMFLENDAIINLFIYIPIYIPFYVF